MILRPRAGQRESRGPVSLIAGGLIAISLGKESGFKGGAAKDPLTKLASAVAAHLP